MDATVNGQWLWLCHEPIPCFLGVAGLSNRHQELPDPSTAAVIASSYVFLDLMPKGISCTLRAQPWTCIQSRLCSLAVLDGPAAPFQVSFSRWKCSDVTSKQRIQKPGNEGGKRLDQNAIPRQSYSVRHMSQGGDKKMSWAVPGTDQPVTALQLMMNLKLLWDMSVAVG
jgi:hypothetical protein